MSVLLRTMLVLSVTSLLMVGCGEKEAAPEATRPLPTPAAVPAPVEAAPVVSEPGGYVPTAEERVPGITLDAVAPATEVAPAATDAAVAAPAAEAAQVEATPAK